MKLRNRKQGRMEYSLKGNGRQKKKWVLCLWVSMCLCVSPYAVFFVWVFNSLFFLFVCLFVWRGWFYCCCWLLRFFFSLLCFQISTSAFVLLVCVCVCVSLCIVSPFFSFCFSSAGSLPFHFTSPSAQLQLSAFLLSSLLFVKGDSVAYSLSRQGESALLKLRKEKRK